MPGLNKSREELPWLYYPRSNSVRVINSHLDGGGGGGGETPIADEVLIWCPSADDVGNGTSTLTDLSVNSFDGTLTNMDAASDWVSDTGSSGVRALDLDGVNDYIDSSVSVSAVGDVDVTFGAWVKTTATTGNIIWQGRLSGLPQSSKFFVRLASGAVTVGGLSNMNGSDVINDGNWHSIIVTFQASLTALYIDGVLDTNTAANLMRAGSHRLLLGANGFGSVDNFGAIRADDFRIWNKILDSTQIANFASRRAYGLL